MDKVEVQDIKETVDKVIKILGQSDFSIILKLVFFLAVGIGFAILKRSAKKIAIKKARKEEQESQVKTEIEQTQESGKVNEQVKQDGNNADIFLGE